MKVLAQRQCPIAEPHITHRTGQRRHLRDYPRALHAVWPGRGNFNTQEDPRPVGRSEGSCTHRCMMSRAACSVGSVSVRVVTVQADVLYLHAVVLYLHASLRAVLVLCP